MNVLIGCEESGVVRDAFRKLGHNAWSCDILPCSGDPTYHLQMDVFDAIKLKQWDLAIFHPPCTYLTTTGNKWMKPEFQDRFPNRIQQRKDAIKFFIDLYNTDIPKIAVENPVGIMSSEWRKPDQYVHPYYFGDPHSKKTGLWLKNLPKLVPTNIVEPQFVIMSTGVKDPLWHYETIGLPPDERSKARSKTFQGIADQMAAQWSNL